MLDVRSSSATSLDLQGAFIERPQQQGLSGWVLGPLTPSELGLQISGPTRVLQFSGSFFFLVFLTKTFIVEIHPTQLKNKKIKPY